jgi:hypothetical protein
MKEEAKAATDSMDHRIAACRKCNSTILKALTSLITNLKLMSSYIVINDIKIQGKSPFFEVGDKTIGISQFIMWND